MISDKDKLIADGASDEICRSTLLVGQRCTKEAYFCNDVRQAFENPCALQTIE